VPPDRLEQLLTEVDDVIAKMGLPSHPSPEDLCKALRDLSPTAIASAIRLAALIDARGWPTATLGDGGSRSTDGTSSTERAAILPPEWAPRSYALASFLHLLDKASRKLNEKVDWTLAHASDVDYVPAGTGNCLACEEFCSPVRNPNDRIVKGFCPKCYKAFLRDHQPERGSWIHQRKKDLTDEKGRIHAPAPNLSTTA
jgi:hypothetical protein